MAILVAYSGLDKPEMQKKRPHNYFGFLLPASQHLILIKAIVILGFFSKRYSTFSVNETSEHELF